MGARRRSVGVGSADLGGVVGLAAVVASGLYIVSDVVELVQGGFSTLQLAMTYGAEAAIPLFVLGLYAVQRPQIGPLGLFGAVGYAYAFVFLAGTVLFALLDGTADWQALGERMGPWITVHGLIMVVAGAAFGVATVRARVLPRWTGAALFAGVVLVAASAALSPVLQTAAAGVRDLAFAGMGACLLSPRWQQRLRDATLSTLRSDPASPMTIGTTP